MKKTNILIPLSRHLSSLTWDKAVSLIQMGRKPKESSKRKKNAKTYVFYLIMNIQLLKYPYFCYVSTVLVRKYHPNQMHRIQIGSTLSLN